MVEVVEIDYGFELADMLVCLTDCLFIYQSLIRLDLLYDTLDLKKDLQCNH